MGSLPAALANDQQVVAYIDRRIRDAVSTVMFSLLVLAFVVGAACGAAITWLVMR